MKKSLIVIFAISIAAFSNAQKSKQDEGIKLGIKGGLNVSNLMGDVKDVAIRTSIHIGIVAEVTHGQLVSNDLGARDNFHPRNPVAIRLGTE